MTKTETEAEQADFDRFANFVDSIPEPRKLLEMSDVARITGWPVQRCRRVLRKAGIAEKMGGRWVTTRAALERTYFTVRDQRLARE